MFFYYRLDDVMEQMNNLAQLKDFLGKHGINVEVVDLSKPKINSDEQSAHNSQQKSLQELFSDIVKDLDLASPSPVKILDENSGNADAKIKSEANSDSNTKAMGQKQHTEEKRSGSDSNNNTNEQSGEFCNHEDNPKNFTQAKVMVKPTSAITQNVSTIKPNSSKLQDIEFKMRELKRKIAVEESSANLIQLTLDLAALAEEKQKEEGSLELEQFQQNMMQAMKELDNVNKELATLANMFKAWNDNGTNGVKEMYGMKEMLDMQVNKLQSHFTQLKQMTK